MKNKKYDFSNVSMVGRFAYSVMCAERYALEKYPAKDWKPLFTWMWKGTSDYFDEWYYRFIEILPEYLYEFDSFEEADFEYLTKEQYTFYSGFMKDLDDNMVALLTVPAELSMVYAYSTIPGNGKESLDLLNKAIKILNTEHIELPDPQQISFSSFSVKNGWGEPFDGSALSIVLN